MTHFKYKKGFTLIELLVVIAIIGLLSSVVLASVNSARGKARNAKRLSDIKQYALIFEMALDDNGEYPDPLTTDWRCLGSYSDGRCWANNMVQSANLDSILLEHLSSLPATEGLVGNWEGALYRCINRSPCKRIDIRWFMEGANQSCGNEITLSNNYSNLGVTYCSMLRSF